MIRRRWFLLLPISYLLAGCARPHELSWQGYAEGEYLALAAPTAGYLATLDAPRGLKVTAGTLAFTLTTDPDLQAAAGADARVASAQAHVQNLAQPRRRTEIAALEAALHAASASAELARAEYTRSVALAERHLIALQALDEARSRRDTAEANVSAARETLATAQDALGRLAEVAGARSDLDAARADAAQKHWAVARKQVLVPATGEITDTYYRPGEWVPSGAPVASLLPEDRRRIRFYVPETELARVALGAAIIVHCDACTTPIRGTIDYIAAQAEYTPPVIYSRETRARLVFRVEAAPVARDALQLRPGLPLDVTLAP
jgi:HlyD family secretion protein